MHGRRVSSGGVQNRKEGKRRKEGISSADLRAPGGANEESSDLRHCDYWTSAW